MEQMRKHKKRGAGGFTLVELIVVIAALAILAGVGTVAYSGYIKRARKAVDQQLVADIAYALDLAAAAGEFNSVEPPVRLGGSDLGLIPIGYVKLSNSADCVTYSVANAEGSYTATEDQSGAIARALAAAFGDNYQSTLRLQYDWSASTASGTGTANFSSASFITDVDELWERVQELSNTVYERGQSNAGLMTMLFGTTFDSSYDVISKSASPLAYLNLSAEGRSLASQWWSEPSMGVWLSANSSKMEGIISANGGEEVLGQLNASLTGCVYARNTCMLNYIREQGGICSNTDCLNYKDANNERVTVGGADFGVMTGAALNDAIMGGYGIEEMFCNDCLKYAKVYCSEYAANDALCFLEVMDVVQQTDAAHSGETAEQGFAYYNDYINAVTQVYGAMADAKEEGSAVISVYYSNGQLSIDCSPVELAAFRTGKTPTSSVPTPVSNVVRIILTEDESGNYTYTASGVMTLDWGGQIVGYLELYKQEADGTLTLLSGSDYGLNNSGYSGSGEFNCAFKLTNMSITASASGGVYGTGVKSLSFYAAVNSGGGVGPAFGVTVQMKDSSASAEIPTNYYAGFRANGTSNTEWYQMREAQVGYAATQTTGGLTVSAGSTVNLVQVSVSDNAVSQLSPWSMSGYTITGTTTVELSNISVTASGASGFSFNQSTGVLTVSASASAGDSYTIVLTYNCKTTSRTGSVTEKTGVTKTLTVTVG